jgi:hypothetical protein
MGIRRFSFLKGFENYYRNLSSFAISDFLGLMRIENLEFIIRLLSFPSLDFCHLHVRSNKSKIVIEQTFDEDLRIFIPRFVVGFII